MSPRSHGTGCLLALLAAASSAWAGQEEANELRAPGTVQQAYTPLERAFAGPQTAARPLHALAGWMQQTLKDQPAFFRDTELTLKPRSYFFHQDQSRDTSGISTSGATRSASEAWALGGSLGYRSGWLNDRFRVGAEYFGSWPLYAGENAGATRLLSPSGGAYAVLGQAYAQFKHGEHLLTAGRSDYSLPYGTGSSTA